MMKPNETPEIKQPESMESSLKNELEGKMGQEISKEEEKKLWQEAESDLQMAKIQDQRQKLLAEIKEGGGNEANLERKSEEELMKIWEEIGGGNEEIAEMKEILAEVKKVQAEAPSMEELLAELAGVASEAEMAEIREGKMPRENLKEMAKGWMKIMTGPRKIKMAATVLMLVLMLGGAGAASASGKDLADSPKATKKYGQVEIKMAEEVMKKETSRASQFFKLDKIKELAEISKNFSGVKQGAVKIGEIWENDMNGKKLTGLLPSQVLAGVNGMEKEKLAELTKKVEDKYPGIIDKMMIKAGMAMGYLGMANDRNEEREMKAGMALALKMKGIRDGGEVKAETDLAKLVMPKMKMGAEGKEGLIKEVSEYLKSSGIEAGADEIKQGVLKVIEEVRRQGILEEIGSEGIKLHEILWGKNGMDEVKWGKMMRSWGMKKGKGKNKIKDFLMGKIEMIKGKNLSLVKKIAQKFANESLKRVASEMEETGVIKNGELDKKKLEKFLGEKMAGEKSEMIAKKEEVNPPPSAPLIRKEKNGREKWVRMIAGINRPKGVKEIKPVMEGIKLAGVKIIMNDRKTEEIRISFQPNKDALDRMIENRVRRIMKHK